MFITSLKFTSPSTLHTGRVLTRARSVVARSLLLTIAMVSLACGGDDGDSDGDGSDSADSDGEETNGTDDSTGGETGDTSDDGSSDSSSDDTGETSDTTGDDATDDDSTTDSGDASDSDNDTTGDGTETETDTGDDDTGTGTDTGDDGTDTDTGDDGTGTDTGTDTGPVDGDDFCEVLSQIMCEAEVDCCTNTDWDYDSVADCLADQVPQCETDLQALIDDSRTAYDPARARQVLDALASDTASCDLGISQWFVSREDGLLSVFAGTVANGGDCSPANADDGGAILSCTNGNACRVMPIPLSGTCGAHKTAMQQCVTHFECEETLWCTAMSGGLGQCQARKANAESCTETIECDSLQCEAGSCVAATVDLVYCANR